MMRCAHCHRALEPGLMRCPGCGAGFAAPVPYINSVGDAATRLRFRQSISRLRIALCALIVVDLCTVAVLNYDMERRHTGRGRAPGVRSRVLEDVEGAARHAMRYIWRQ